MAAIIYTASVANIALAARLIDAGKLVILPTDTAYALAGDISNSKAVADAYNAKQRPLNKFFPMLVSNLSMARCYTQPSALDVSLIDKFWPGGLTLILPVKKHLLASNAYNGDDIATRAPNHPFTLEVIKTLNRPIIGTSANISNGASLTGAQLQATFFETVSAIFIDSLEKKPINSTIISTCTGKIEVLRQGCLNTNDVISASTTRYE